eukprot:SAG22_NODE_682_length_7924_cov_25.432460_9_plen_77_part_00
MSNRRKRRPRPKPKPRQPPGADYYASQPHPLVHSRLPPQRRKPHQLPFLDADVKPEYKQPPRSVLHHRTPKSNLRL